jgi:hypothetical protein
MPTELAELSSISTTLEQLARRVGGMGDSAKRAKEDEVAYELFAVERALNSAQRRLAKMIARSR